MLLDRTERDVMEVAQFKKFKRIGVTAFIVIAAGLLVYFLLFKHEVVADGISTLLKVLSPIIWGFVIAYILNTPMCFIENLFLNVYAKRKKVPSVRAMKVIRTTSAFMSLIFMLLILYAIIALLLPELRKSIMELFKNLPNYYANLENSVNGMIEEYVTDEQSKDMLHGLLPNAKEWFTEQSAPQTGGLFEKVTNRVMYGLTLLKNFILGLFVSMYVLLTKDSIFARFKRGLYAFFNAATANNVLKNIRFIDDKFGGFLIGKILDSLIIGVICYIVLSIMDMPYTLIVSVIVGVTNIIPFFGPFIGAIPSGILICCASFTDAVYFAIFILILQQIDGNIIGPKILGNSVGVSSFMVLVAILVGGGLFGFVGMIVAVPLCAIITSIIQSIVLQRAARKNLPGDIEAYNHMRRFDPVTRKIILEDDSEKTTSLYRRILTRNESIRNFCIPLENNPWDHTLEDVEQEKSQFKLDYEADVAYCKSVNEDAEKPKRSETNLDTESEMSSLKSDGVEIVSEPILDISEDSSDEKTVDLIESSRGDNHK